MKNGTFLGKVRLVAMLILLLTMAYPCHAKELKKPHVKHITINDAISAAIALMLCRAEVPDVIRVELVEENINGKTRLVYRSVDVKQKNTIEKE